jgi:hypothetical protein
VDRSEVTDPNDFAFRFGANGYEPLGAADPRIAKFMGFWVKAKRSGKIAFRMPR